MTLQPTSSQHLTRPHERGFTLVELSTVAFIIVILVSLLTSALNSSRAKALQIACMGNNLKQLSVAWMMYLDENDDRLPLNRTAPGPAFHPIYGRRSSTNSWVAGNPREDRTTRNIEVGTLFPYVKSPRVYRCQMDKSHVSGDQSILRNRSYSMSSYLNGDNAMIDPRVKVKSSELENPSPDRVFVFIEEHENSIWASSFLVLPREKFSLTTGTWSSTPADRHSQGANLAFADGHVEHWRWSHPKKVSSNNLNISNVRELNDLRRLQSSVPKP